MRPTLALVIAINLLVSCQPATPRPQLPDQIRACEAVFLPWLTRLTSEDKKAIRGIYFPDAGEVAFPDAFFEKYRGTVPPILRTSELKGEAVENKDWFWHFSNLRLIDKDTIEMNAGYYCGGLCAMRCEYRVGRQPDGSWKIIGGTNCISS
jgi:hypothetical protein